MYIGTGVRQTKPYACNFKVAREGPVLWHSCMRPPHVVMFGTKLFRKFCTIIRLQTSNSCRAAQPVLQSSDYKLVIRVLSQHVFLTDRKPLQTVGFSLFIRVLCSQTDTRPHGHLIQAQFHLTPLGP